MTPVTQPLPPDDPDRLLSAYFRAQVPDPFPPCRALAAAEPSALYHARTPAALSRSRLTLAASVAALLGLGLMLTPGPRSPQAGKAPSTEKGTLLQSSTADGSNLLKPAAPETSKR